jgi:hypothetical protein
LTVFNRTFDKFFCSPKKGEKQVVSSVLQSIDHIAIAGTRPGAATWSTIGARSGLLSRHARDDEDDGSS